MTGQPVERDERTTAVVNAGYRWSYLVLSFGLLAVIALRSFLRDESPWDLLALVILGGVVNVAYQGRYGVLYRRWGILAAVTLLAAFTMKFIVLAALSGPADTTVARALQLLFEGITLGSMSQPIEAPASGYLAFGAIALYLFGLVLLPPAQRPALVVRH